MNNIIKGPFAFRASLEKTEKKSSLGQSRLGLDREIQPRTRKKIPSLGKSSLDNPA